MDSTLQNPSYQYTSAGTYAVKLTVTNTAGSDPEVKTGYITVSAAPVAPIAAFSGTPRSGTAPLTVTFTDSSSGTGPLTYAWDFQNDGSVDSTLQNPSYQYAAAGTYAVKLTVTNTAGSDPEVKTGYITVSAAPVAPIAAFSATPRSGTAPLTVTFTDSSSGTGPLTYAWDFQNDGSVDSTLQNPSYQYAAAGTYAVKLTVTNTAGSDPEVKTGYITVSAAPVAPIAAFSGTPRSGTAPLTVTFTDASSGTGPLTYAWDFQNDGSVDSTLQNPSYQYAAAGTYTVKLTVTNTAGSDSEIKANYVMVTSGPVTNTGTQNGVFRPSTGIWYLDTTKTGVMNKTFQFGKNGDVPVVGDWNGDGVQMPGYSARQPGPGILIPPGQDRSVPHSSLVKTEMYPWLVTGTAMGVQMTEYSAR